MNDANMCVPTSFFYTLKTAYEMRMSDWSSDVCSSDLAGSVAIAINLSNIYPTESPGGWHLLGRTPVEQFDLGRDPPILLSAGDRVRFRPVEKAEYDELKKRMEAGDTAYAPEIGRAHV